MGEEIIKSSESVFDAAFWRVTAALALISFSISLMNQVVFPLFDPVFMFARDISVTANVAFMIGVGLLAAFKPQVMRLERTAEPVTAACLIIGSVMLIPALAVGNVALLIVSSSLFAVGRAGAMLVIGLAATGFDARKASACIGIAFTVRLALDAVIWAAPVILGIILFLVCPLVSFLLTIGLAKPLIAEIAAADAPADVAITQPSTFLPLASQLFVCLFLFSMAFGFSLRFGEVAGTPLSNMIGFVPVALIAIYAIVRRKSFNADLTVQASVLIVAAGFFLSTVSLKTGYLSSSALLATGNALFEMVAWLVLIMLAGRNRKGALAVFAWGRGVAGVGSLIGAALGMVSNQLCCIDRDLFAFLPCLLMLLVVGYALIGMRSFSFADTIEGVTPAPDALELEALPTSEISLEDRCRAVAEEHGLSSRELEVFEMLAEGRDRAYIEEKLVISRNTVKAHVKHIYAKLDIHSHQDLIALVHGD